VRSKFAFLLKEAQEIKRCQGAEKLRTKQYYHRL